MKNKDFFYLQYNKINWKNQEKTKINSFINDYIVKNIILKHKGKSISLFDIGFGIGFFIRTLLFALNKKYKQIEIAGCEPSKVNYDYWLTKRPKKLTEGVEISVVKKTFQEFKPETQFDYVTAIYVFPHFLIDDLPKISNKIHSMLKQGGKFILVLANEEYLENKLKTEKDLSIETRKIVYKNTQYKEILHYSDIPQIGKVIDYNREENFYIDLFKNNKLDLDYKKALNDNGFVCTLFVFSKK